MPTMTEEAGNGHALVTSVNPIGPNNAHKGTGSVGDVALKDSLLIILVCWAIVGSMYFSLRRFNV